ncbi:MAG: hypothetical protein KDA85_03750, partial [Planctomycetaceae bacterium]|nr:hypothetical protein [Planctomycetaceae bacterium]
STVPTKDIDPLRDAQQLIQSSLLDTAQRKLFEDALERLKRAEPFGSTPLVYALIQAVRTDLQSRTGIVIAITDGEALDAGADPDRDKRAELKRLLDESGDIHILLVSFDIATEDEKERIASPFNTGGLEKYITVVDADNKEEILKAIEENLSPPQLTVRRGTSEVQLSGKRGDNNTIVYQADELIPGDDYSFAYAGADTTPRSMIALRPGDDLQTQMDWMQTPPSFLFSRRSNPQLTTSIERPSSGPDAPIHLSALAQPEFHHSQNGEADVELMLMLDHNDPHRPVRQPAEIEFEFRPATNMPVPGGFLRPRLTEELFTSEAGAPAWKVRFSDWPVQFGVRVNAFWKMQPTTPDLVLTWDQLVSAQKSSLGVDAKTAGAKELFPSTRIWWRLPALNRLQIRLDRNSNLPESEQNSVQDIRVQVGRRDATDTLSSFHADEVTTTIRRMENGTVVYEFDGDWTPETRRITEFAFTSRAARLQDSIRPLRPLELTEPRLR